MAPRPAGQNPGQLGKAGDHGNRANAGDRTASERTREHLLKAGD
jgi:hypothetical protein